MFWVCTAAALGRPLCSFQFTEEEVHGKVEPFNHIGFLVSSVLVLAANSWAQSRPPNIERIAKTLLFVMWAGPTIRHNFLNKPAEWWSMNLARFRPFQQKSAQVRFRCAVYSQL